MNQTSLSTAYQNILSVIDSCSSPAHRLLPVFSDDYPDGALLPLSAQVWQAYNAAHAKTTTGENSKPLQYTKAIVDGMISSCIPLRQDYETEVWTVDTINELARTHKSEQVAHPNLAEYVAAELNGEQFQTSETMIQSPKLHLRPFRRHPFEFGDVAELTLQILAFPSKNFQKILMRAPGTVDTCRTALDGRGSAGKWPTPSPCRSVGPSSSENKPPGANSSLIDHLDEPAGNAGGTDQKAPPLLMSSKEYAKYTQTVARLGATPLTHPATNTGASSTPKVNTGDVDEEVAKKDEEYDFCEI